MLEQRWDSTFKEGDKEYFREPSSRTLWEPSAETTLENLGTILPAEAEAKIWIGVAHLHSSSCLWFSLERPSAARGFIRLKWNRALKDHGTGSDLRPRLTFQDAHSKEMAVEQLHHGVLGPLSLAGKEAEAEAERERLLAPACYVHDPSTCALTSPPPPASGRHPPASPGACG